VERNQGSFLNLSPAERPDNLPVTESDNHKTKFETPPKNITLRHVNPLSMFKTYSSYTHNKQKVKLPVAYLAGTDRRYT
jgi:hypothetical protein